MNLKMSFKITAGDKTIRFNDDVKVPFNIKGYGHSYSCAIDYIAMTNKERIENKHIWFKDYDKDMFTLVSMCLFSGSVLGGVELRDGSMATCELVLFKDDNEVEPDAYLLIDDKCLYYNTEVLSKLYISGYLWAINKIVGKFAGKGVTDILLLISGRESIYNAYGVNIKRCTTKRLDYYEKTKIKFINIESREILFENGLRLYFEKPDGDVRPYLYYLTQYKSIYHDLFSFNVLTKMEFMKGYGILLKGLYSKEYFIPCFTHEAGSLRVKIDYNFETQFDSGEQWEISRSRKQIDE